LPLVWGPALLVRVHLVAPLISDNGTVIS